MHSNLVAMRIKSPQIRPVANFFSLQTINKKIFCKNLLLSNISNYYSDSRTSCLVKNITSLKFLYINYSKQSHENSKLDDRTILIFSMYVCLCFFFIWWFLIDLSFKKLYLIYKLNAMIFFFFACQKNLHNW